MITGTKPDLAAHDFGRKIHVGHHRAKRFGLPTGIENARDRTETKCHDDDKNSHGDQKLD